MFKKYYFWIFIIFLNWFCYVISWDCHDSILNLPGKCMRNEFCDSAKELKFHYGIPSTQCYNTGFCCVSPVSGNVENIQYFRPRISAKKCIANKWGYRNPQPYLGLWKINGLNYTKTCAGAPITSNFILTSASCTIADKIDFIRIYHAGLYFTDIVYPEQVLPYPSFDKMTLKHDIGLIKLTSPINFSKYYYPCLWQTDAIYSKKLTILDVESSTTSYLYIPYHTKSYMENPELKTKLTLFKNDPCEEFIVKFRNQISRPNRLHMDYYKICLGNLQATKPGCAKIISGTPITTNIGNTIYIVGVASETECQTRHLMRHSRVSSYLDWIEDIVWKNGYTSFGYRG